MAFSLFCGLIKWALKLLVLLLKKMFKNLTCITRWREKLYHKETGYILNYFTLTITDK